MAKCYDCMYLAQPEAGITQFKCSKRKFIINHNIEVDFECDDFQDFSIFLMRYDMNHTISHEMREHR